MSTQALYLRTLSSLEDISFDESNTIVFAVPIDTTKGEVMGLTGLTMGSRALKTKRGLKGETKDSEER